MQPGKEHSAASRAKSQRKRTAYDNAMNSKTAGLLGISLTRPPSVELDPPHSGNVIAQAVFECVAAWKIEDKVISITLDNASNNDGAIRNLKAKFAARGSPCFVPKYFHVRCCAHIINLVVTDGTAAISHLTANVRETVKYIKKSNSRLHKFVEICHSLAMTIGGGLKLDVTTRWNSTFHMLKTAIAYKDALDTYSDIDAN